VRIVNSEKFSPPYHFLLDNIFSSCRSGVVLASSNNTLVGNRFSDCDQGVMVTDEINPLQPQIRAGASGNELFSCTFEDCRLAIELINATGTMIEGSSFVGGVADLVATASTRTREVDGLHTSWEGTAVRVVGGDYGAENVSLLSGPSGFRLEGDAWGRVEQSRLDMISTSVSMAGDSVLDLINTSHPRRYDVDSTSKLRVWWDVEVETGYESGGEYHVPGTLDIRDREGGRVGSYYCMPSGLPVSVVVLELELEGVTEHNWTPHSFTVTTSERACNATVGIFRFTRVLLLLDDVAPTIEVEAPEPGGLNRSLVWFSGHAADGAHGPAAFVVRIDGVDSFSGCGTWAREVRLEDGPHVVTYVATDGSGNSATFRSELLVDTTPPDLVVTEPGSNETLTSAISIRVTGRVTGHRLLLLDGEEVPVNGSRFEFVLLLDRDGEYTLRLVALDWLNNSAFVTLRVLRDTEAPHLELDAYEPLTREVPVLVGGSTDRAGARVFVNGEVVNILPGGRFSVFLDLLEGPNGFLFRALDETGNEALRWANITLDTATTMRVISPLDNTTFEVQDIEVVVLTESGASVRFAGHGWREADADGYWRAEVTIMEGTTLLKVEVRDVAGNEAAAAVTVHYRPPPVEPVEEDFLPMVVAILAFSAVVALLVLRMRKGPSR
jgi:parallel beta-helix repeat protein